jgi:transposase
MKRIPQVKKLGPDEKAALSDRLERNALTPEDCEIILNMFDTLEFIFEKVCQKDVQLKALLKRILGIKSEKSKKIRDNLNSKNPSDDRMPVPADPAETKEDPTAGGETPSDPPTEEKAKGHGRIGADAYTGAERVFIPLLAFKPGDKCPECPGGKVCPQNKPGVFIHIEGRAPIGATIYELEKYRRNLCGEIFSAELPDNVAMKGGKYYDPQAKSMIAILRYGGGFPLNRLGELQKSLGIPIPVSTLWDKTEEAGDKIWPVYEELKRQAAQGDIIHNDDTGMKILSVIKEIDWETKNTEGKTRTGMFTTGIVSLVGDQKIALFFTGRQHAGENFADLLEKRTSDRDPPIQMCDAKSGNVPKNAEVLPCYCNTHARRNFVNVAGDFPDQCLYVIDVFATIYKNDALAKELRMPPEERLQWHLEKSGPTMESFHVWLNNQFDKKQVEPNSSLGKAIAYVLRHWKELTRFLHVPGVPLDNNICERALKKIILHRKNSLFHKTEHGACVGDMFMSLIHTCNLAGENPFDYLTQLQVNSSRVFKNPDKWLPWNWRETLSVGPAFSPNQCGVPIL